MYCATLVSDALKHARGRCTYGNYSAARCSATVDFRGYVLADMKYLSMHFVVGDFIDLYGSEGSKSDVKRYLTVADSHVPDFFKQGVGEMKTGRGCSRRALLLGVDGLVVALVFKPLGDIRWQGHISYLVEDGIYAVVL